MGKKSFNKGYSLVEILVTAALFTVVAGALLMSSQSGVKSSIATDKTVEQTSNARNAIARLSDVISQSKMGLVSTRPCVSNSSPSCKAGTMEILVKIPVKTPEPVANTIYTETGAIKFGAAGRTDCFYHYRINSNNELVRRVGCATEHACGDGSCEPLYETIDGSNGTETCPQDCQGTVGDGICNPYPPLSETIDNSIDCQVANDGTCTPGEICGNPVGNSDCCSTSTPNDGDCSPGEQCGTPAGNNDCCGGGESGGGCFLAGTLITMADGTQKPIEQIRRGDKLLAFDKERNQFKPDKVTKILKHTSANGYLLINGYLKVTPNHPVISDGYWVQVGFLKEGNRLLNTKGEYEEIKTLERFEGNNTTYNLEVNPYHTYIAGGYVVHNGVRQKGALHSMQIGK